MNLEMLRACLSDYGPRLIANNAGEEFNSLRLITPSESCGERPGILYVGMLSSLYALANVRKGSSFLCIEDIPYINNPWGLDLLLVENTVSLNNLLNEVRKLFAASSEAAVNWNALLDMALRQSGAQEIVDIAFWLFENPVILSDRSTKLIVRSGDIVGESKLWKDHSEFGYFSYETMQSQNYKRISRQLEKNAQPILLQKEISQYDTINGKIYIGNTKIANLSIINSNRPFREADVEMLNRLCKVFSYYFKMDGFYKFVRDARRESFFKDVIENKFSDAKRLESRAMSLNLKTDGSYCVLTATSAEWHHEKNLQSARLELEKHLPKCYTLIIGNGIVAILDKERLYYPNFNLQDLKKFLLENQIQVGVSRNMSGLSGLHEQYLQAVNARRTGAGINDKGPVFEYDDYALYCLFLNAPSHINLKEFCNRALLKLIEYDRENDTEYVKTLYTFLGNNGNYTNTAKALFIHRTSVIYRMKKLEEILETPLGSSKTRNRFYVSFLILFSLRELESSQYILTEPYIRNPVYGGYSLPEYARASDSNNSH
jgi:DNA-binding PucR family transcriptional regulator